MMTRILHQLERSSPVTILLLGLAMLVLTGAIDYLTGYEMFFSVFYLLEVGLVTWYLGKVYGLLMSILSVGAWIGGDLAAGAQYSSSIIPIWNTLILLVFYAIVVGLITRLRSFHHDLEAKVQQRTMDLRREMAERERLEEEIINISEREQQRIGHDLHDSLCQHLTGTALAGQVLSERLAAQSLPEAADAEKIVGLVEEGIDQARKLAHGLAPVEMDAEGLMASLQTLANNLSQRSRIKCVCESTTPVLIEDDVTAINLYRITQEAISNAIRHGKAKEIIICLSEHDGQIILTIEDNGIGLPETALENKGLGIRIMAHRATKIGGSLVVEPASTGGTIVMCTFPNAPSATTHALTVNHAH